MIKYEEIPEPTSDSGISFKKMAASYSPALHAVRMSLRYDTCLSLVIL